MDLEMVYRLNQRLKAMKKEVDSNHRLLLAFLEENIRLLNRTPPASDQHHQKPPKTPPKCVWSSPEPRLPRDVPISRNTTEAGTKQHPDSSKTPVGAKDVETVDETPEERRGGTGLVTGLFALGDKGEQFLKKNLTGQVLGFFKTLQWVADVVIDPVRAPLIFAQALQEAIRRIHEAFGVLPSDERLSASVSSSCMASMSSGRDIFLCSRPQRQVTARELLDVIERRVQSGDKLPNMRHFQVKMTLVHKPVAGSFRASFPHADPSDVNTCFPVALKLLSHFGELVEMWDRFERDNSHRFKHAWARKEWDRKLAAAKEIFLNCNTPHVVDSAVRFYRTHIDAAYDRNLPVPLSEVRGALERFKTVRGLRVFLMDRSGNLLPESPLYTDATGPVLNMLFDERDGHVIPIVGSLNSQPWVRVLPDGSEERFFHEFQCRQCGWMVSSFCASSR
ncbi:unnamed protein product, partial [Mesorhabditis spiculigera]